MPLADLASASTSPRPSSPESSTAAFPTRTGTSGSSASAGCSRRRSTRTQTGSSSASSTWASRSRTRSSAVPGTSAPAPPSPSRSPARLSRAGSCSGGASLRGEESAGMILSEQELELGQDHSGIIVLDEGEPGTPLGEVLPLQDVVLDLEITGNRPDLLSVYGVAREIAALFRLDLAPPPGRDPEPVGDEPVDVDDRGLRRLPALHRTAPSRRAHRALAAVAPRSSRCRGDAADLQRRRRDQLRDARARQPAARVRPDRRLPAGRSSSAARGRARS